MATYTEIHIRRDSTLNWYASNPRLALGEPGVDMDLHRFKIGNGIDRWNQLPYMDADLYKQLDDQQQATADAVQDLLNKIAANKLDADTKHNTVTTELRNTSRELNERMTAVENEQVEYEEFLTGEFEETKAEVHAGLEEFAETRDKLNTRMDVIVGEATEDTEILDARVDAEYQTHPNLGANIRNIHEQLIVVQQTQESDKAELDEKIAELESTDEVHDKWLSTVEDRAEKLSEHGEFLQGEIDTNAEAIIRTQIYLYGEAFRSRENDAEHSAEIARLSSGLEEETATREEADSELRAEDKSIRRDLQDLTERLGTEEQARREDTSSARESALLRDEHLQEQTNELAGVIISEAIRNNEERQARVREDEALRTEIAGADCRSSERVEHLQDQADKLAEGVLRLIHQKQEDQEKNIAQQERETSRRIAGDEHLQDQADMTAQGVLELAGALSYEAEQRRKLADVIAGITSPVDWSKAETLAIPEPRCAVVNFTGLASMPTSKTVDIPAVLEFWDLQGNYFKKPIVCSAQGAYSMNYIKKNVKFDLLNIDGSEFSLKIGDWVAQDGFHLKAYYVDFFRGIAVTAYDLWEEIMRFNGPLDDRPYKKVQIDRSTIGTAHNANDSFGDIPLQTDTGALCHPDGFPCIVYLNGTFYGVFSWQLKKHRKNYRMDKSTVEHIHIDGNIRQVINGQAINWTTFELRNPNKLYTMNGKKYDGDAPLELIDETSEKFDAGNKDHVRTAQVKGYVQGLAEEFTELRGLYAAYLANKNDETLSAVRTKFEALFDWQTMRDYTIFIDITHNWDGITNNVQWTTYDGMKWFPNAYDLDLTFSRAPLTGHLNSDMTLPFGYVPLLYGAELEERYGELRDAGIISVEGIASKLEEWVKRVGPDNYELEYQRWPQSTHNDSVYRVRKWLEVNIANMDKVYNYEAVTPQDLINELHEAHNADVRTLKASDEGGARIREAVDSGLQEQIDELSNLILRKILDSLEDRRKQENDTSHEIQSRQTTNEHQQEQTNELAGAVLWGLLNSYRTQEKITARIAVIEEALIEDGILDEDDIPRYTDEDIDGMLEGIFSGSNPEGEPDITDETDQEFYEDIAQIFNP